MTLIQGFSCYRTSSLLSMGALTNISRIRESPLSTLDTAAVRRLEATYLRLEPLPPELPIIFIIESRVKSHLRGVVTPETCLSY